MTQAPFSGRSASQIGPALSLVPVVPSDDTDLSRGATRALYVASAGDIVVVDAKGGTAVLTSVEAQYHPISVRRVMQTGTTATGIVALY